MSSAGREYVLGTDTPRRGIVAELPPGGWAVTRHDVIGMESKALADRRRRPIRIRRPRQPGHLVSFRDNRGSRTGLTG